MSEAVFSALFCMRGALTLEMAQHHARRAVAAGASPELMAEAWMEWHRLQDEQVQVVRSNPS